MIGTRATHRSVQAIIIRSLRNSFLGEKKEISVNSDLFSCVVLIKQLKHDYMQLIKRMT